MPRRLCSVGRSLNFPYEGDVMSKCGYCGNTDMDTHQILACKVDKYKKSIELVLNELHDRLPESNREGFLAEPDVYDAIETLTDYIKET